MKMASLAISRLSQAGLSMALTACELISYNVNEGTVSFLNNTDDVIDTGNDDREAAVDEDEEEQELSWLKDAGCSKIASSFEGGDEDVPDDIINDATMTLTKKQTAAVRRRIRSLKEIRRQKSLQSDWSVDKESTSSGQEAPGGPDDLPPPPATSRPERALSDSTTRGNKTEQGLTSRGRHISEPNLLDHNTSDKAIHVHSGQFDSAQDYVNPYHQVLSAEASADGLPELAFKEYQRGICNIEHLSSVDREEIRKLAHIELADIFDSHKIRYARRKEKRCRKSRGMFGVPLKTLLERDQKKHPLSKIRVPIFYEQLISHLSKYSEEKGLLRIPGLASGMKSLRQEIDEKFAEGNFDWESVPPHDATGLLKQFVRELPQPMLTIEHLDAFIKVHELPDVCDRVLALNLLILILPDVHRNSLKLLLSFLHNLVKCEMNSMDLHSIGTVMAPNLFFMLPGSKCKVAQDIELQVLWTCITLCKMLIKYHRSLWTVPSSLYTQLEKINELQDMERKSTMVNTLWYA